MNSLNPSTSRGLDQWFGRWWLYNIGGGRHGVGGGTGGRVSVVWEGGGKLIQAGVEREREREKQKNLKYIEEELKGKFFGGATIDFADIAHGWTANLLGAFKEVTGIKFINAE
ncbi:hypothetical protein Vadar_018371 [Vaccinium darrowii]|uniref:Uncharacterized protein n=1 Tax=Vaccinium darrowii TaxID=229202 RepID=A0ACB7ZDJ6_9ERIC|nr:hypothetical protein Vadar_018371 [Vaccinium darrowii]